jgi:cytochrome c-type biogenesis protein CcmH/NrfG
MSRLADSLMGMDRGRARLEGLGGMPPLTASGDFKARWRPGAVLVIVVSIVGLAVIASSLRPNHVAQSPAQAPAPICAPSSVRSEGARERFVALSDRGLQAARDGDLGEAVGFLRKALDLNPNDADMWNTLGVVLVRQGETARGVDAFDHALRVNPSHADAHRNLAVALDRQGRSREAVAHYRSFLSLSAQGDAAGDDVRRRLAELVVSNSSASERE